MVVCGKCKKSIERDVWEMHAVACVEETTNRYNLPPHKTCDIHPTHNPDSSCPNQSVQNTLGTCQRIPGVNRGRPVKTISGVHYPLPKA